MNETYVWEDEGGLWEQLSPRRLEHHPALPSAITLHRLVPRPRHTTSHKSSVTSFKYIIPEELEEAQTRARHDLLVARLQQSERAEPPTTGQGSKKSHTKKPSQPKSSSVQPASREKKNAASDKSSIRPKPRPHIPTRQGIGEESLRVRQLTRFVDQIGKSVNHLENIWKQDCTPKDFVMPLDNEVKQRRWEEFLRSAGRSLFSLKQEICVLERTKRSEDTNSKFLRSLAVAARSLLRLLLALQTHADKATAGAPGRQMFGELVVSARRLFPLISSVGVHTPKLRVKSEKMIPITWEEGGSEGNSSNNSSSVGSEVSTSDVDTSALATLSQRYVRDRIAFLADHHLGKKRKWNQKLPFKPSKAQRAKAGKTRTSTKRPLREHRARGLNGGHGSERHRREEPPSPQTVTTHQSPTGATESSPVNDVKINVRRKDESARENMKCNDAIQDTKKSIDSSAKEEYLTVGLGGSGGRTPSDARFRVIDGQELVENTAEAVVERLRALIGMERKESEPEDSKAQEEETNQQERRHPQNPDLSDITRQIRFMLERVCRIEEDQKEAISLVENLSSKTEQRNGNFNLTSSIRRAQEAMASLSAGDQRIYLPNTGQGLSSKGIILTKTSGAHPQHSQRVEKAMEQDYTKLFMVSEARQEENQETSEERYPSDSRVAAMSVADQVQKQKEEFWASLIERGFLRPQVTTERGSKEQFNKIQMITTNGKEGKNEQSARERLNSNSKVRRFENIGKPVGQFHVQKKNKETQVTSLFQSSNLSSSQLEESKVSQESLSMHSKTTTPSENDGASASRQTSDNEDKVGSDTSNAATSEGKAGSDTSNVATSGDYGPTQSSPSVNSSQSGSFPSYDGASKS